MAKLIAVDWDRHELRLITGSPRSGQLFVDQIVAVALEASPSVPKAESGNDDSPAVSQVSPEVLATALGKALNKAGVAKGEAIVSIGRNSVELRTLQVPGGDEFDLPDMVRFQAQRQFANLSDSWPLDYVPLPNSTSESVSVLAAAVAPPVISETKKLCEEAGLEIAKLVLRPFAAAQLLSTAESGLAEGKVLMVEVLGDEADLAIVENGKVIFVRSVRLPSEELSAVQQILLGEMRRTLVAATTQSGGDAVEKVVIWTGTQTPQSLAEFATQQLGLKVQFIDPFSLVQVSKTARGDSPDARHGRFAPLIGALVQEASANPQTLDFLHPRKRPPKKKPYGRYATIGAAAAVPLILGVGGYWYAHSQMNGQISDLQRLSKSLDGAVALSNTNLAKLKETEKFIDGEVNWLEEIERMSQKLPPSKNVILADTNFNLREGAMLGEINTTALISSTEVGPQLEESLRDPAHKTEGKSIQKSNRNVEGYPWSVAEIVTIHRVAKPAASATAPAAASATSAPATSPDKPKEPEAPKPEAKPSQSVTDSSVKEAPAPATPAPTTPAPASSTTPTPVSPAAAESQEVNKTPVTPAAEAPPPAVPATTQPPANDSPAPPAAPAAKETI